MKPKLTKIPLANIRKDGLNTNRFIPTEWLNPDEFPNHQCVNWETVNLSQFPNDFHWVTKNHSLYIHFPDTLDVVAFANGLSYFNYRPKPWVSFTYPFDYSTDFSSSARIYTKTLLISSEDYLMFHSLIERTNNNK